MEELVTKSCYILFGSNSFFVVLIFSLFLFLVYFISKKVQNKVPFLFIVAIIPLLLFGWRLLLNDYFLSDDFDHFVLSSTNSYSEIFKKGIMAQDLWAFHRLFVGFFAFKFIYSIFGANYYAFVIVNLVLHILNAYLLFQILKKLTKNIYLIAFCLFVFSSFYLTWISNIHELLAGLFFLITFNLLMSSKFKFASIVTYILGIFSKEVVFVLPVCYLLFLTSYNNLSTNKKLTKKYFIDEIIKLKYFLVIFVVFVFIFIGDFLKFSQFSVGSGYDTVYRLGSIIKHLIFYTNWTTPILYGTFGFILFISIVFIFDIVNKKLILTPLYVAFLILLFPVLFLSKSTSYYLYIPIFFLNMIFLVLLSKFKHINTYVSILLLSIFIVFVFKLNLQIQENCFLIQNPRPSTRRQAVDDILNGVDNNTEEAKWIIENNYAKYLKK